jgi:hypothetical protein
MTTPTPDAPVRKLESPLGKLACSAGVTVLFEACVGGHYLEMVKILKQTSGDSYAVITKRMVGNKGIAGLLDGFVPWGAMQALVKGGSFGFGQAFALKSLHLLPELPGGEKTKTILSGGIGGITQGICMSPMLLLKTRVMTDPRFRTTGGFFATSYHSLKLGAELVRTEGGLLSLTKGMGVFSFKRFCDWTTRYGFVVFVESLVKEYPEQKLQKSTQMLCSLAGGTMSALATVPIDVTVAMIQQADKAGKKVSVLQIYGDAFRSGGVASTLKMSTRGLVPRVTHVALTVMMMKNVSSWAYTFMLNRKRHMHTDDQ